MPHVLKNLLTRVFPNILQPPFVVTEKFSHHPKNSDNKMVLENFQLPHLVPFWPPPMVTENL
jgi:hypothetical protein